jgi:phosphate:Na+ symporter
MEYQLIRAIQFFLSECYQNIKLFITIVKSNIAVYFGTMERLFLRIKSAKVRYKVSALIVGLFALFSWFKTSFLMESHTAFAPNQYGIFEFDFEQSWSLETGLLTHLLIMLGALGFFIYGMKTMSEGIQKAAANQLRKSLSKMTSSNSKGILTGFLTTALVQSSSATTVMVVSFVNNGLVTMKQSIGIIMGANVGTTITGWLIAIFGFVYPIGDYSLILFLIAITFLFSNRNRIKSWGETLAGLSIFFMAIELLKAGIPENVGDIEQFGFLQEITGTGLWKVVLATIIGAVLTVVVQSSTAALLVTILLCERGIVPYELGLGMVIGGNIGTTITSNIAAIPGNVHAKRAARAHLLFNLIGAFWMALIFPWFIQLLDVFLVKGLSYSPSAQSSTTRAVGIASFHTAFNVLNLALMAPFSATLSKWVIRLVPKKVTDDDVFHLDYIKAGVLATPELSILEAKKEVAKFGRITSKMLGFFDRLLIESDYKNKKFYYDKIAKYEEITDRVEVEITDYLAKVAENDLSDETSKRVRGMIAITGELERIGDVFYHMSLTLYRKESEKVWFSPEQRKNLKKMIGLLENAFGIMLENLNSDQTKISYVSAVEIEQRINDFRDALRLEHFGNLEKQEYNVKSGIFYSDLFYSMEKIGDHIISVTEAIVNENIVGEKTKV